MRHCVRHNMRYCDCKYKLKPLLFVISKISMGDIKHDISRDTIDRGEDIGMMEPTLLAEGSRFRRDLTDLALELVSRSAGFRRSLPPGIVTALANLVRSMNCYYSNLIEGHDTHPIEIERALKNEYSQDTRKRNLQLEAKAHIQVQRWIDSGHLRGHATTRAGLTEIHRRFCVELPEELLWVEDPETHERLRVVPGELRQRDVRVGRHIPVSPGAVPRFFDRFENAYSRLGKTESILAAAAAHHRFAWIHPFLDGNGRMVRLMSHATLLETLETGALWSVARGLARRVETYKELLANCDCGGRNDLDGRGPLSEEALVAFTRFFLETCLDQITFMENLVQPEALRHRILGWAEGQVRLKALPANTGKLLEAVLYRGELPRAEVADVLHVGVRQGQRIVAELVKANVLVPDDSRAPLRIAFPATLASQWTPGLFPEKPSG
jgi:Fic family protein